MRDNAWLACVVIGDRCLVDGDGAFGVVGEMRFVGRIEEDDVAVRTMCKSLADNSFHGPLRTFGREVAVLVVVDGEFHEKHVQLAFRNFGKDVLLKSEGACVRTCRTDSRVDEIELAVGIKGFQIIFNVLGVTVHFRDGAAEKGDVRRLL